MLVSLSDDLSRFSFVDIGSGEGRMLLVALAFPFREIIGVEFAKELHEVAVENIREAAKPNQESARCQSLHLDATEFVIPRNECVIYFNNPFGEAIFSKVLENIRSAYADCGKKIYVLYSQPRAGLDLNRTENIDLLRRAGWLRERELRLPTLWDRLLLGSYELYIFESHDTLQHDADKRCCVV